MSLQEDLVSCLSGVASGHVYSKAAPADVTGDYIVFRIAKAPEMTLSGYSGITLYTVVLECYSDTYAEALSLVDDVIAAVESSSLTWFRDSSEFDEYIPDIDNFMEPVQYGIWYE